MALSSLGVKFFFGSLAGSLLYQVPTILPKNRMFSDPSLHYLVQYPKTKTRAIVKLKRRPAWQRSFRIHLVPKLNVWRSSTLQWLEALLFFPVFTPKRRWSVSPECIFVCPSESWWTNFTFFSLLMRILIRHKDSVIWVDFSVLVTNFYQFSGGAHLVTG